MKNEGKKEEMKRAEENRQEYSVESAREKFHLWFETLFLQNFFRLFLSRICHENKKKKQEFEWAYVLENELFCLPLNVKEILN